MRQDVARRPQGQQKHHIESGHLGIAAMSGSLATGASRAGVHLCVCLALELFVENAGENIITELGVLEAQLLELGLCLAAKGV